jgi:hypothetical protein
MPIKAKIMLAVSLREPCFLGHGQEHRLRAEQLRKVGRYEAAKLHDVSAKIIERRRQFDPNLKFLSESLDTLLEEAERGCGGAMAHLMSHLRFTPAVIAEQLHLILAKEDDPQAAPEFFHLDLAKAVHDRFREKVFLYREASVLLVLLTRAQKDPLFEQTLREYERILFPTSPETPAGATRLQAVKAAMKDLQALIDAIAHDGPKFTWAQDWFASIGHHETDPITNAKLSLYWSHKYVGTHETLDAMIV